MAAEGETERAESILAGARTLCEDGGYGRELAFVIQLQAYLDVEAGRREQAISSLEEVRAMAGESGVRALEGGACLGLAAVEARWGSAEKAIELWARARELGTTYPAESWRLGRKLERDFLEPLRDA